MAGEFLHLFDTALGRCGIAWGEKGIVAITFPEATDALSRDRLRRRATDASETDNLPQAIQNAVSAIVLLLQGNTAPMGDFVLDYCGVSDFEQKVYALSMAIPVGKTRTYGDLARDLGDVALSQRVGQSLGRNPFPIIVPCHRIVGAANKNSGAKMTGFSAPGGIETKRALLKIEGAIEPDLFDLAKRAD